jgi:hypothetical protein
MAATTALSERESALTSSAEDELNVALKAEQELNRSDREVCARHFKALFVKRWHYSKRDQKALVCQLALPVAFLIFGFAILQIPPNFTFPVYPFVASERLNTPLYTPVNTRVPDLTAAMYSIGSTSQHGLGPVIEQWDDGDMRSFSDHILRVQTHIQRTHSQPRPRLMRAVPCCAVLCFAVSLCRLAINTNRVVTVPYTSRTRQRPCSTSPARQ